MTATPCRIYFVCTVVMGTFHEGDGTMNAFQAARELLAELTTADLREEEARRHYRARVETAIQDFSVMITDRECELTTAWLRDDLQEYLYTAECGQF